MGAWVVGAARGARALTARWVGDPAQRPEPPRPWRCEECGQLTRREPRERIDYSEAVGLAPEFEVTLSGVAVHVCGCGEAPEIPSMSLLLKTIGLALREEYPDNEVAKRYLRKLAVVDGGL